MSTVDQGNASAAGDITGRDKIGTQINVYDAGHGRSSIQSLKERLKREREDGSEQSKLIDQLQRYHRPINVDGVIGLENKLIKANRREEFITAIDDKEDFAKLLQNWSLYGSAQEIFASFMARAIYAFRTWIKPRLKDGTEEEINQLFDEKIVQPILEDIAGAEFHMSHAAAMGLIYWLADKCYIRWHP